MTPIEMFTRAATRRPQAIAVEAAGATLSYAELLARVEAVAAGLQQIEADPGARVGICAYNSLDHLIAFLSVFAAGHIWVPLYPRLGVAELPKLADFVGTRILFVEREHREIFAGLDSHIVTLGDASGPGTLAGLEAGARGKKPRPPARPLDATQAIKFTGGTTGLPKAVMQPARAWNTNIVTQIMSWGMGLSDRTLIAAPMTHGGGTYLMPVLASGGTLVIEDRLTPERLIEVLDEQKIATVFLPPTAIQMMSGLSQAHGPAFPKLRNLIYGGGPMRADAVVRAQEVFGPRVATTYGQTEAPQIVTCLGARELAREELRASVGRETLLTRVAIMDERGGLLPPGETGEVVVRGDLVMTGYWQQPQETAEALKDGWLHTGDLGELDSCGYLFLKGRLRDVIISGGFNVYPGDVEHVLGQHEAVTECAAFGVPDEKWGEAVHAAVELTRAVDAGALIDHVKAALGPVKAPKHIHVYEMLPRNAYGKLQRQALIDAAIEKTGKGDE